MKKIHRISTALGIGLFLLYTQTMSGHLLSPDGEILYRTAVSFYEGKGGKIAPIPTSFATHKGYAQYGIGQPILALPLIGAGRNLRARENEFDFVNRNRQLHTQTDLEWGRRRAASHFNQVIVALTGALIVLFAFRLFGDARLAVFAGLTYGIGTMAWPYSRAYFTEPLAGLCILAAYYLAFQTGTQASGPVDRSQQRRVIPRIALAGVCFGYSLLTRLDSLMFLPGLLYLVLPARTKKPGKTGTTEGFAPAWFRCAIPRVMAFAVPFAIAVLVIASLNWVRFGGPFETGYSDQPEGVRFVLPVEGIVGFVFSSGRSIFLYCPILVLSLFGWGRLWGMDRRLTISLAAGTALFFLFEASWQNWSGGWDWGPRHIFQLTALWIFPALAWLHTGKERSRRQRWGLAWTLLGIGLLIQLLGVSVDFISAVGRDILDPVTGQFRKGIMEILYDPLSSGPAIHIRELLAGHHDLYWLHQWEQMQGVIGLILLPGVIISGVLLWRMLRKEDHLPSES